MENPILINLPESVENLRLPDPNLREFYKNLDERVLWIDFEIDESLLDISKYIMRYNLEDKDVPVEKRKPIKLLIFTHGGRVDSTFNLIDIMELSKTPIYTYNMGNAMSAGFQILISGHKRFCLKRSTALYHSGSGGTQGTFEQTQAQMKEYKRINTIFEKDTLSKTKIDSKTFAKNKTKEWYMSAEEQLEYGVVDKILTSIDEIFND